MGRARWALLTVGLLLLAYAAMALSRATDGVEILLFLLAVAAVVLAFVFAAFAIVGPGPVPAVVAVLSYVGFGVLWAFVLVPEGIIDGPFSRTTSLDPDQIPELASIVLFWPLFVFWFNLCDLPFLACGEYDDG